jgi:ribosomal peptide maturation radical SAM protein 1
MAEGIAGLSQAIDYIFSGESEETFVAFLAELFAGKRPAKRIIYGQPCQDLDALPVPDFQEYYEQLDHYLPAVAAKAGSVELTYETSRGCWWGQKHHCTFCGLNGMGMGFREKSAGKVITELKQLLAQHPYPTHLVQMTDNIMPYTFFKTLVPELAGLAVEMPTLRLYYEQKANLSLEQVLALMKAGITHIQPGIEALSTSLLKRMDKGVTAAQNIALLRYAHSVGMRLDWNLLWGFPGDTREEYEETLALLPLLHHLEPPISAHHLRIDRFSPYFDRPEAYSITNLRPLPSYQMILPPGVDPFKVAYHFTGDYESESHTKPDIIEEIEREMAAWQANWDEKNTHITLFFGKFKIKELPILEVTQRENGFFLLRDTRGLPGTETEYRLSHEQASVALVPRRFLPTPEMAWALEHKVGVVLDTHQYVPLATASPELLQEFEAEVRREKSKQPLFEKIIPLTPSRAQESRW